MDYYDRMCNNSYNVDIFTSCISFSPSWGEVEVSVQMPVSLPPQQILALCLAPSWSQFQTGPRRSDGISHI